MINWQTILLPLVVALCFNCTNDDKVNNLLLSFDHKEKDPQLILFIPIEGCSGCTQKSLQLAKEFQDSRSLVIILSHFDRKKLNYILKEKDIIHENVYFDTTGILLRHGFETVNPFVIYVKENKIIRLKPNNINEEIKNIAKFLDELK